MSPVLDSFIHSMRARPPRIDNMDVSKGSAAGNGTRQDGRYE